MQEGLGAEAAEELAQARASPPGPRPYPQWGQPAGRHPPASPRSSVPAPGRRPAPASVAFLKGQVLRTRGRGLEPCTRPGPSRSGTRSRSRLDFRAMAARPAEKGRDSVSARGPPPGTRDLRRPAQPAPSAAPSGRGQCCFYSRETGLRGPRERGSRGRFPVYGHFDSGLWGCFRSCANF